MRMCPISAATPKAPRCSLPSSTMPPPTPVPTVTSSSSSTSLPAPKANSPHAARWRRSPPRTGSWTRASSSALRSRSRHARLGANMTCARPLSTYPAAPIPTQAMSCLPQPARSRGRRSRPRSPRRPSAGDSTFSSSRMRPSASTTPPAILVPPTSTPQASRTGRRRSPRAIPRPASSRSMCSTSPRSDDADGVAVARIPAAACISEPRRWPGAPSPRGSAGVRRARCDTRDRPCTRPSRSRGGR